MIIISYNLPLVNSADGFLSYMYIFVYEFMGNMHIEMKWCT